MTAKILLVEDDESLTALLSYNLVAAGFECIAVASGGQAVQAVSQHAPNLVILDWVLPELSGIEICGMLRAAPDTRELPIMMLTARGLPQDKLKAFEAGVDDYIVKPFSVSELIARIHALLRRAYKDAEDGSIRIGELRLDELAHRVRYKGSEIPLGPIEFRLLEYLIERRQRVLTRSQLIERVWQDASDVNERTVDIHIGHLRRALLGAGVPDLIETVRGVGYMLACEED